MYNNIRNINRIDSGKTHGFFVRTYYMGLQVSCFFSDKKYGSQPNALKMAVNLNTSGEALVNECRTDDLEGYEWLKRAEDIKKLFK